MSAPVTSDGVLLAPPRYRTLEGEALRRGFVRPTGKPNTRRFAEWCTRYKVPVFGEGKTRWVRPEDVDHAVDRIADKLVDEDSKLQITRGIAKIATKRVG